MASFRYSIIAFLACLAICYAATLCTPDEITQENVKKLAKANNYLALNIYQRLSSESSENIFFSPLSLSTAFGMLYYGTKGTSAKELRNTLGYEKAELPEQLVHQTFQGYLSEALPSQDPSAYVLNSANSILLDKHFDFYSSYRRGIEDVYQALIKDVDFLTENQEVVSEVNKWVKEKTNGKIEKLLDDLDPSTVFVLLNAVYFKGTWKTEFDSQKTREQVFYNGGLESGAKNVPMMRMTKEFLYTSTKDAQIIELPYKGENISMLILLPKERDGLKSVEQSLSLQKLSTIRNQLYETDVHVSLPKFKVEYSKEMSSNFKSLGANSIFSPGADFSGMTSDKNIYVSQVIHKAVVEVNEEGSEAAAVTGIISNRMGIIGEPNFYVDHPFLFSIVDKRNDMILFVGRVTNL